MTRMAVLPVFSSHLPQKSAKGSMHKPPGSRSTVQGQGWPLVRPWTWGLVSGGDHHPVLGCMWGPLGRGSYWGGEQGSVQAGGGRTERGPGCCVLCLPSLDPCGRAPESTLLALPLSVCVAEQEVVCLKGRRE